jgi:hypothetical protein
VTAAQPGPARASETMSRVWTRGTAIALTTARVRQSTYLSLAAFVSVLCLADCSPKLAERSVTSPTRTERRQAPGATVSRTARTRPAAEAASPTSTQPEESHRGIADASAAPTKGTAGADDQARQPVPASGGQWITSSSITSSTVTSSTRKDQSATPDAYPAPAAEPAPRGVHRSSSVILWSSLTAIALAGMLLYWLRKPA